MTSPRFLLDTNTVSRLLREDAVLIRKVARVPTHALAISSITAGELWYGLAKRATSTRWSVVVEEFLRRVDIAAFDDVAARRFGALRADMERRGTMLAPLDLQIAAHALARDLVLVSNDAAFRHVVGLRLEDWCV